MSEFIMLVVLANLVILVFLFLLRNVIAIRAPVLLIAVGFSIFFCILYPFLSAWLLYPKVLYLYAGLILAGAGTLYMIENKYFTPEESRGSEVLAVGDMIAAMEGGPAFEVNRGVFQSYGASGPFEPAVLPLPGTERAVSGEAASGEEYSGEALPEVMSAEVIPAGDGISEAPGEVPCEGKEPGLTETEERYDDLNSGLARDTGLEAPCEAGLYPEENYAEEYFLEPEPGETVPDVLTEDVDPAAGEDGLSIEAVTTVSGELCDPITDSADEIPSEFISNDVPPVDEQPMDERPMEENLPYTAPDDIYSGGVELAYDPSLPDSIEPINIYSPGPGIPVQGIMDEEEPDSQAPEEAGCGISDEAAYSSDLTAAAIGLETAVESDLPDTLPDQVEVDMPDGLPDQAEVNLPEILLDQADPDVMQGLGQEAEEGPPAGAEDPAAGPGDIKSLVAMAFDQLGSGDKFGAAESFFRALKLDPPPKLAAMICIEMSSIYMSEGRKQQSLAVMEMLQEIWGPMLDDNDMTRAKTIIIQLRREV